MIASTKTDRTDTANMVLWRRLTAAAPEEKSKCRHCKSLTSHISDESHTVQLGPTFCITMLNKRIQKHTKGQKVNVACTLRIPKCTQAMPWCIFQIRTINLSKYKLPQHRNCVSTSWRCTSLVSGSGDLRPIFPVLSHTPCQTGGWHQNFGSSSLCFSRYRFNYWVSWQWQNNVKNRPFLQTLKNQF